MNDTTIAGIFAGFFALLSSMLAALVVAYKQVGNACESQRKELREDWKTCHNENRANIDKGYALVGAFDQLRQIAAGAFEDNKGFRVNQAEMQRKLDAILDALRK